jgi:hypothetical protein
MAVVPPGTGGVTLTANAAIAAPGSRAQRRSLGLARTEQALVGLQRGSLHRGRPVSKCTWGKSGSSSWSRCAPCPVPIGLRTTSRRARIGLSKPSSAATVEVPLSSADNGLERFETMSPSLVNCDASPGCCLRRKRAPAPPPFTGDAEPPGLP